MLASQPTRFRGEITAHRAAPVHRARILNDWRSCVRRPTHAGSYRLGGLLDWAPCQARPTCATRRFAPNARLHNDAPTVEFSMRQGDEIVYIERTYSERSGMQVVRAIGGRAPLHLTSVGKLFLAHDDPVRVRAYATRTGLTGHTRNSITDLTRLERELAVVRATGVARDDEELELGVRCMAAGVFDDQGKLLAGLSVSAPADRLEETWLSRLKAPRPRFAGARHRSEKRLAQFDQNRRLHRGRSRRQRLGTSARRQPLADAFGSPMRNTSSDSADMLSAPGTALHAPQRRPPRRSRSSAGHFPFMVAHRPWLRNARSRTNRHTLPAKSKGRGLWGVGSLPLRGAPGPRARLVVADTSRLDVALRPCPRRGPCGHRRMKARCPDRCGPATCRRVFADFAQVQHPPASPRADLHRNCCRGLRLPLRHAVLLQRQPLRDHLAVITW